MQNKLSAMSFECIGVWRTIPGSNLTHSVVLTVQAIRCYILNSVHGPT